MVIDLRHMPTIYYSLNSLGGSHSDLLNLLEIFTSFIGKDKEETTFNDDDIRKENVNKYTVQVESGHIGKNGRPSVGPVYRSSLSKDGFPPLDPGMGTSWQIFRHAVENYPGNKMLGWREFREGKAGPYIWKTYQEVYEEVLCVGSALRQLDVAPGSRVGIYGANCPQWVVTMEACNGYSLICVPLYDTLGAGAVDYIIEHAEIDVAFLEQKKVRLILPSDGQGTRLKSIISFTTITTEESCSAAAFGIKAYSWHDFFKMGKEYPSEPLPPRPLDICTIMYTSGTSGTPKGMTADDVYFSYLPLAHILDRIIEEYFFCKGASVGYFHGDTLALGDDLVELKPMFFAGVPLVFERIHRSILKTVAELRPLRRLIFDLLYKYKLHWMRLGYSHKSASPLADLLAFSKAKERLGGRVRLLVSGGAPLTPEVEEFLRVTTCSFVRLWTHRNLRPGDIGEISSDGILVIIDRKNNFFKLSQGEYVAAEHLEKVYSSVDIIEDIWVYGNSHRSMLVAVVVPREDNTKKWALLSGHEGVFTELCALKELNEHILEELKLAAEKNKLRSFEDIRGIVVDPVPFDVERDLVTPTMKKKRTQMLEYYLVDIEKVYGKLLPCQKIFSIMLYRSNSKSIVKLLLRYKPMKRSDGDIDNYLFRPDMLGPSGITPLHIAATTCAESMSNLLTDDPGQFGLKA
ncbi:hypothetical protein HPP92_002709 [Vanilla planifolia]|uniref:4-coumarate--CoA ligase n=1 Tax=Vanilla planifolia TaxID=51239 RepID=A0A835S600_VANPL|nr:hypothetical protein HPP92_002709 [Vanilla planifolia]